MQWAKQKQAGFTIVELLIVVVVIAILAAITIVSYNGITERARMAGALSYAAQIQRSPEATDTNGLYKFDACSGSAVVDSSGKGADGVVTGTAQWSTDTPTGSGCSFQFNGSTRITVPVNLQTQYYLKAAWVKMTSCVGGNNIISTTSGSSNSHAWYLPTSLGCRMSTGHNASWGLAVDTAGVADGKWHHLAVEYRATSASSGTLSLWRDGVRVASADGVSTMTTIDTAGSQIGAYNNGNMFTGLMDDVIIISR